MTARYIAPLAQRRAAVEHTRKRLPQIVYRSMMLEGESVTIEQAEEAVRNLLRPRVTPRP